MHFLARFSPFFSSLSVPGVTGLSASNLGAQSVAWDSRDQQDLHATVQTRQWPVWLAAFVVSAWLASVGNIALWVAVAKLPDLATGQKYLLGVVLGAAITCACTALFTCFSWMRAAKPLMILLCWIAACASYFMLNYGTAIDATMLVNVLQTDMREARDLLHWSMPITIGAIAIPPTWWLWHTPLQPNNAWRAALRQLGVMAAAIAAMLAVIFVAFQPLSTSMRNHSQLRYMINPLSSVYAVSSLAAKQMYHRDTTIYPMGLDAKLGASYAQQSSFPIYVLVVGETGRAGNFGLYGYERRTTPMLSARHDLAIAKNAWSCGTSTAVSLPCMFSHLGRAGQGSDKSYENLLDILQRAGLAVLWVDNQSGCKGVCDRIPNVHSIATSTTYADALCKDGECTDMALLEGLDERINAMPVQQRSRGVVLVLHQMGSHGPAYFKRSLQPDKQFMPECTNVALQSCGQQAIINAYDNSIVATDRMLGHLIHWLEQKGPHQASAMVYVADHGESLGENNIYLHGLPYAVAPDVQKHVPWITWLSPLMQQRLGVSTACLQQTVGSARISHDNYFHSVLGLTDIQTDLHQPQLDIFARCAGSAKAG